MSGLGSVRIVKNFDLGLENATSVTVFHYTDQTSQPAKNIYLLPFDIIGDK